MVNLLRFLFISVLTDGMRCRRKRKKADVDDHRGVFDHVGLLVNGSPGSPQRTGSPFS
jgi:hypothetical protein